MSLLARPVPLAAAAPARPVVLGPNWFASVMGTGIVANAAATLPVHVPGLLDAARAVWVLDVVLLVVLTAATVVHWRQQPDAARRYLHDPVLGWFYGAPAMALMTVGAGALLVGVPLVGLHVAVAIDAVLWTAGTLLGLATAVTLPYLAFTRRTEGEAAFGGWLMPIVPPMVSASTGPLLAAHLREGQPRLTMLLLCGTFFGLALVSSLVVIAMIWSRLVRDDVGAPAAVPTYWIVLGPLGQSVTAAHTMTATAGSSYQALAVAYGLAVWGFALMWMALAVALTVRTAREGLPFSLTWWSFTFPVGTVVTGTSGLAVATGADLFKVLAVVLYVGLVTAWVTVATRTLGGVRSGTLLRPAGR